MCPVQYGFDLKSFVSLTHMGSNSKPLHFMCHVVCHVYCKFNWRAVRARRCTVRNRERTPALLSTVSAKDIGISTVSATGAVKVVMARKRPLQFIYDVRLVQPYVIHVRRISRRVV